MHMKCLETIFLDSILEYRTLYHHLRLVSVQLVRSSGTIGNRKGNSRRTTASKTWIREPNLAVILRSDLHLNYLSIHETDSPEEPLK